MADYDVIVAGGGLAGTITAQAISHYTNQNTKILVVDRNPKFLPGRKSLAGWVCGDACSKEAVDFMSVTKLQTFLIFILTLKQD